MTTPPPLQISSDIDLDTMAEKTEGFSGSDLRELCRNAAIYRVRDLIRAEHHNLIQAPPKIASDQEYVVFYFFCVKLLSTPR